MRIDEIAPRPPLTPAQASRKSAQKLRKSSKVQRDIADIRKKANDQVAKKMRDLSEV